MGHAIVTHRRDCSQLIGAVELRAHATIRNRVGAVAPADVLEMIEADEAHHSALDVATWLLSTRERALQGNRPARPRRAQRAGGRLERSKETPHSSMP
jgi:hypothetical protein